MNKFDKVRRKLTTQLAVNTDRTRRRMRRLTDDELLSIYEEGSNLFFHAAELDRRAQGGHLMSAAVYVLRSRYEPIRELDLGRPFPLRDWMNGIPNSNTASSDMTE